MKIFIYSLLFTVLLSCQKSTTPPPDTSTPPATVADCGLFPLKLGNSWVYNTTMYDQNTGVASSTITNSVKLETVNTYNGIEYFNVDSFEYPIRNKDCNTLALYNPTTNKEINVTNNYSGNDSVIYDLRYSETTRGVKILANKDRVKVGSYDCYKLEFRFTSLMGIYYRKRLYFINEKVGVVRTEGYNIQNGVAKLTDVEEMTSFDIK